MADEQLASILRGLDEARSELLSCWPLRGTRIRLRELEQENRHWREFVESLAQQVHQAYHGDVDYTWRECRKGVCANVQAALREAENV